MVPVDVNGFLWKPVLRKISSLQEIETHWSLIDLVEANISIAAVDAAKKKIYDKMKKPSKGGR